MCMACMGTARIGIACVGMAVGEQRWHAALQAKGAILACMAFDIFSIPAMSSEIESMLPKILSWMSEIA
jgi:hypothetical protein